MASYSKCHWQICHDIVWQIGYSLGKEKGKAMPTPMPRSEKLDLRLTPAAKEMLQDAAASLRRSVSEFVLESALTRAEEALADRRHFGLDAAQWEAFMQALDAPTRPMPRLERLFSQPSVFEKPASA
jgi:uncharacterized protein (DUF1778 family)